MDQFLHDDGQIKLLGIPFMLNLDVADVDKFFIKKINFLFIYFGPCTTKFSLFGRKL
jgi:hypothetical protein